MLNYKMMFTRITLLMCMHDVVKAINHLKYGTSDGEEGLWSGHLIHDTHNLYVMLTLLFNVMLVHGICPTSILLGTMVRICKNQKSRSVIQIITRTLHLVVFSVKPLFV